MNSSTPSSIIWSFQNWWPMRSFGATTSIRWDPLLAAWKKAPEQCHRRKYWRQRRLFVDYRTAGRNEWNQTESKCWYHSSDFQYLSSWYAFFLIHSTFLVERKHLELVPHELTEQQFWSKFFQSHYYHRERDVLPNPNDPFSDCVRLDDADCESIIKAGVDRRRFDLNVLNDNTLAEYNAVSF